LKQHLKIKYIKILEEQGFVIEFGNVIKPVSKTKSSAKNNKSEEIIFVSKNIEIFKQFIKEIQTLKSKYCSTFRLKSAYIEIIENSIIQIQPGLLFKNKNT
jgi:hypothetical protein